MKIKKLFLSVLFSTCFLPLYAGLELGLNLPELQTELTGQIADTKAIKQEMLNLMDKIDNANHKETLTSIDYSNLLKEKMPLLPKKERLSFLKTLISKAEEKGLIKDLTWTFLAEEAYAKPAFTEEFVQREAKQIVESLQKNLVQINEKSLAQIVKRIKVDMIKMVSQEDGIALINAFNKTYAQRAALLGKNEAIINLFLKDVTNNNLIVDIMLNLTNLPREHFARNVMPALMHHFSLEDFIVSNKNEFLTDLLRNGKKRSALQDFTKILSKHIKSGTFLTDTQKMLMAKIDVLSTMTQIADTKYKKLNEGHISIWYRNERKINKIEALKFNFGELSPQNARELNKLIKDVPMKELEKVLPGARSWMESFTAWANKSITPKSGTALTIASMVAITIAGELIQNATTAFSQNYDNIDKITDALADNNIVNLVYNNVYDDKFNMEFNNYINENSWSAAQEKDFIKTHLLFEEALYANFIDESDTILSEEIWQCALFNENCAT